MGPGVSIDVDFSALTLGDTPSMGELSGLGTLLIRS